MGCLYFVRHGQSEWNVADKICGSTDSPLTELGHKQAIETGKAILDQGIKANYIIYSPLSRAMDTALHISEMTGIPAKAEPRIMEQNFGKWEGTSPRNSLEFRKDKTNFINSFGNGESMFRMAQRIYNVIDEIIADEDHTYIMVAHNGIARFVNSYFHNMENQEFADFSVKNCQVNKFEW
nr:histidine phosphatase family protein [Eubacteriales bacterium]